ncbi:MAG TPA: carbamoyltransferase HypF [Methanoregulaceae archaeon]|nr:carbamoyltransferase HypF [Methanoregulaceae archaeon]
MEPAGIITVKGIVQGVGFRPFVYARATELGIRGSVKNLGSEVEIRASGRRFSEFLRAVSTGPPMARIDSVDVRPLEGDLPEHFVIETSGEGSLSGMIPPDIATCYECIADISTPGNRYESYWATSCVNCGPRYSIIRSLPYDRERTSMALFPMCRACENEYLDPQSRRHHAQTIASRECGPGLGLLDSLGNKVITDDILRTSATLLDGGHILAIRGIGGFHLACTEQSASTLKKRLGRTEQPFAVMVKPEIIDEIVCATPDDRIMLTGPERPIVVMPKRDPSSHADISNLHTIGCMLPYTGLHHLLFRHVKSPLLIMTSANLPGYPMITDIDRAMAKMHDKVDYFLTHNRPIVNRCDDSVVREGHIIRLSRGIAPKRTRIDLGNQTILGVGPELNANATIYKDGFSVTSPHVGNVRNPQTFSYLQETVGNLGRLLGARYDIIAHDAHPRFLSTQYAKRLAREYDAELFPVQHHRAHIAATTTDPCIGIAIDGVGYGDDGTVWGGEVFAGTPPDYRRVGHLEVVPMPGGDLATRFPERMLYGILPSDDVLGLLASRGWNDLELGVLEKQLGRNVNVWDTSSTGRVLDAVSALLGLCRERTYDGEPAMKLESAAYLGNAEPWDLSFLASGGCEVLSTRSLCREALTRLQKAPADDIRAVRDIAASFQYNLARGIALVAVHAAGSLGFDTIALSGGVAINTAIRDTIHGEVTRNGYRYITNREYPLGDGCISFGQCICAAKKER